METTVLIAIITSGVSLIIGIFTAIWGFKKNITAQEIVTNSQERIKKLEFKYESANENKKVIHDENKLILKSYKNAISSAQKLKDKLTSIINAPDESYFSKVAIDAIEEIFANEFAELEEIHFDPYHEIKNIAVTCENLILLYSTKY
jgi:hypothetical protein